MHNLKISALASGVRVVLWVISMLMGPSAVVLAQPSLESIRVMVVQEDASVDLEIHGRFRIVALESGITLQQGRQLPRTIVRATPKGLILGQESLLASGIRIEPHRDATISLNGKRLRGAVEVLRRQNQSLQVINDVAIEEYLQGVLSKEAPDHWPKEALKAIAIAARTYALYQRVTKAASDYDVTADVMSQDYGGKGSEKLATTRAVKATAGLILTYEGRLFPSFYHSTCGGITEHARSMGKFDIPPLHGGVVCRFCEASPFFFWQRRLTKADIAWALRQSLHGSIGPVQRIQVIQLSTTNRVEQMVIVGEKRTIQLSGFDFRKLLGFERIRSPLFSILDLGDEFVLEGHGWGHGVGMCQWGAMELSRRGLMAQEILAFYYPQSRLVAVGDLLPHQPLTIMEGGNS